MSIVEGYMPTHSTNAGAWQVQTQQMIRVQKELERKLGAGQKLTAEETASLAHLEGTHTAGGMELHATPRSMLLHDLAQVLVRMGSEFVVIGMDWNGCLPGKLEARHSGGRNIDRSVKADAAEVEEFMRLFHLVEPMTELAYKDAVQKELSSTGFSP